MQTDCGHPESYYHKSREHSNGRLFVIVVIFMMIIFGKIFDAAIGRKQSITIIYYNDVHSDKERCLIT